ncbi:MAG: heavy metal translocating P-type ATPase, partial [Bacteriovorax sp.]
HPLKRNQSTHDFKNREERKMLLKIGIAGAGAGNIMLYAVSIYAGASGSYASFFNLLTVLFAMPVLFYSATPFYQNAWNAIRNKTLSIDIPISMALLMGALFGLYNLATGVNENYFDSLTALVFLLLLSRYFLNKIQENGLSATDLNFFYEGETVLKKEGNEFVEVHPHYLKVDDIIKVSTNEMIPADGVIVEGSSLINTSLLTGESRPEKAGVNDSVYSGTINLRDEIVVRVEKTRENSRIGNILKQVESGWITKSHIVDLTNKISKYFVAAVFFLSTLLFAYLYSQGKTTAAIERALSLLIVTCPCALALATPLTLTRTLSRASKIGIIIKNTEVIEKLSSVKRAFLDKTGTVTYGNLKVSELKQVAPSSLPLNEIITTLEKTSTHPVAIALKEHARTMGEVKVHEVENYQETVGIGVSGTINGRFFELKNGKIFEDQKIIASYDLLDQVRPDSLESIRELKKSGIDVAMVSGDQKKIVEDIAGLVELKKDNVFYETTPEAKLAMIENSPHAIMIGDGANDAMALSRAYVSVAVLGSLDISLRAADIYLTTPGISNVAKLITISRETMKVIHRNLVLSLLYNMLSVYAAFAGLISPLTAAIIMPLSSLTVLLSTTMGTKKLNDLLRVKLKRS